MRIGTRLIVRLQALDSELLVHGNLGLYSGNDITDMIYDIFIEFGENPADSLCRHT